MMCCFFVFILTDYTIYGFILPFVLGYQGGLAMFETMRDIVTEIFTHIAARLLVAVLVFLATRVLVVVYTLEALPVPIVYESFGFGLVLGLTYQLLEVITEKVTGKSLRMALYEAVGAHLFFGLVMWLLIYGKSPMEAAVLIFGTFEGAWLAYLFGFNLLADCFTLLRPAEYNEMVTTTDVSPSGDEDE